MAVKTRPKTEAELGSMLAGMLRKKAQNPDISNYKPHDAQVNFHSSPARQRLFIGGNRSGKTVAGACETVWYLTGKHPYKTIPRKAIHGRVVASDFIQGIGKIVLPMVARWLPPSALINGSWEDSYDKTSRTLTLDNGNDVEFLSYDQDLVKFAGTSRDFVWCDEEPHEDIFQECLMRTVDVSGDFWTTLTPIDGMTWIHETLYLPGINPMNPSIHVTEVSTEDNPFLPKEAVAAISQFYTADELAARLHGRFVQRAGLVYKEFGPENIVPFLPEGPPKDQLLVASLDHGLNNATAWLWSTVDKQGNMTVFDEHYESQQIVSYHADRVHALNFDHGKVPDYYVGDPSIRNREALQGSSVLEEYASHGIYISLGNNDLKAGYSRVKARFAGLGGRKLYVTENCTNLIKELGKLRWATYASKRISKDNNAKEEQHKKDDHACDSLRYMVMSRPELMDNGTELPDTDLANAIASLPHHDDWSRGEDGIRRAVINKPRREVYDEYLGVL